MTGSILDLLYGPPHLHGRGIGAHGSSYSIDSFLDNSNDAVSRTPSTATASQNESWCHGPLNPEQSEELVRELFAGESDNDDPITSSARKPTAKREAPPRRAVPLWSGALASFPTFSDYLRASKNPKSNNTTTSPKDQSHERQEDEHNPHKLPLLPCKQQSIEDLVNVRPGSLAETNLWSTNLGSLEECDDEGDSIEGDFEDPAVDAPHEETSGNAASSRERSSKRFKEKHRKVQSETMSFLEKLDLKTLLQTPRPDVLSYYPQKSAEVFGTSNGSCSHDPRVEESLMWKKKDVLTPRAGLVPSKPIPPRESRLASIQSTYGASRIETRKVRPETIERLANPILGYSSTLQALSPKQRQKRVQKDEYTSLSILDQLTRSASIYEAAAEQNWGSKLGTGTQSSNNQAENVSSSSHPLQHLLESKKPGFRGRSKNSTKTRVWQTKSSVRSNQDDEKNDSIRTGTFLTQLGEESTQVDAPPVLSNTRDPLVPHRPPGSRGVSRRADRAKSKPSTSNNQKPRGGTQEGGANGSKKSRLLRGTASSRGKTRERRAPTAPPRATTRKSLSREPRMRAAHTSSSTVNPARRRSKPGMIATSPRRSQKPSGAQATQPSTSQMLLMGSTYSDPRKTKRVSGMPGESGSKTPGKETIQRRRNSSKRLSGKKVNASTHTNS